MRSAMQGRNFGPKSGGQVATKASAEGARIEGVGCAHSSWRKFLNFLSQNGAFWCNLTHHFFKGLLSITTVLPITDLTLCVLCNCIFTVKKIELVGEKWGGVQIIKFFFESSFG